MSEQQQQSLEGAITALPPWPKPLPVWTSTPARGWPARHDLQQHLAAERWNAWTQAKQAARWRRRFLTLHKVRSIVGTQ
jgi:hypothetical protein